MGTNFVFPKSLSRAGSVAITAPPLAASLPGLSLETNLSFYCNHFFNKNSIFILLFHNEKF